jgi:hypothetical protein
VTGVNRENVAKIALAVGEGCAELHDRVMVGLRVNRIECDELWAFVQRKRIEAALAAVPPVPTPTAPDRRREFRVIDGGKP